MAATNDHTTRSAEAVCPYCGVGCRLWMEQGYGRMLRVKGVAESQANRGRICAKGATLPQVLHTADRLAHPLVRNSRGAALKRVSWYQAVETVGARFRAIIDRHGRDAVAFYGSGQLDSAAAYLAVKLFKGGIGTNNTDSNSRLCMASAVAAYRTSLGSDGPPTCYDDIEHADLIVIAGSNMADTHPVTFDMIAARRRRDRSLRIVTIDPRRSRTAAESDVHIATAPGSDIALFNAVAKVIIDEHPDSLDQVFVNDNTAGFDELHTFLKATPLDAFIEPTGLSEETVRDLVRMIARSRAMLSFYCMGLGQSTVGMWKINSLINLHLLRGQIGKPGAGPFSLTGQPNAMGGRECGLLAHQLPGYRFVDDAEHREAVERYWSLPAGHIQPRMGLTAVEMFRALEAGRLKAIWIVGTNPAVSMPDLHLTQRALSRAELVVVQDCYHPTETTTLADVVLPAAQWGEREFISTNSERMVSLSDAVVDPPGEAWPDWKIIAAVARRLGYDGFRFAHTGEVWEEFIELTTGRPCDMRGITYKRLQNEPELQWPCPSKDHPGTPRLYTDHRFATADGRAHFFARSHRGPREPADHEFPLTLTTGRTASHWHTLTRTGKVRQLAAKEPEPYIEMHPDDAAERGIEDGRLVIVMSRRGTVRVRVRVRETVCSGLVFMPFHWGDQFHDGVAANYLTIAATGRISKEPEFKLCAVDVTAIPVEKDRADLEPEPTLASAALLARAASKPDLVSVTGAVP